MRKQKECQKIPFLIRTLNLLYGIKGLVTSPFSFIKSSYPV